MPIIYSRCTPDVAELAAGIIAEYRPDLIEAKVTIDFLFAESPNDDNGDPIGQAVKLHGYPCHAIVKIVSPKDRALGRADAEIVIDKFLWDQTSEDKRQALLDHELEHIVVKRSPDGDVLTDDYSRPKLRMKLHDHQFGWFDVIARRHGASSFEVQQAEKFRLECGQHYFQPELSFH